MVTSRRAAGWFAGQAVAVVAWWTALAVLPAFRALFELGDRAVLQSFLVPDGGFALASAVTAGLALTGHRAAVPLAGVTVGAVGYSTLLTCWHVAVAGTGAVGVVAMTAATAASAVALRALHRDAARSRDTAPSRTGA